MKYELSVAKVFIEKKDKQLYEKYGFKVDSDGYVDLWEEETFINIESISDLEKVGKEWGSRLVVDFSSKKITIYNGYLE